MRVLVTGVSGQLGYDVARETAGRGWDTVGTGRGPSGGPGCGYISLDITDSAAVAEAVARVRPDAVIHCAAWTAVDAAEEPADRAAVRAVNAGGTRHVAKACRAAGCKMIYISTDYVFGGEGTAPWTPECTDFAPCNWYGQTKLEGEQAVQALLERFFIVRTSWVFGVHGRNFVRTMLGLAGTHDALRVVDDQIGTPTYTPDLARLLADMCRTERYGVYHASNEGGFISWADFAREIFRQAGLATRVEPVSTAAYGASRAVRPANSRLDKSKLDRAGFGRLRPWDQALADYLACLGAAPEGGR